MKPLRPLSCIVAALALAGAAHAAINFTPGTALATASRPSGSAIADFNGDHRNDLAVTVDTPDRILIFFGNADGTFGAPQTIFTGDGTGPGSIVAADIDGDHDMDLVVALQNTATVRAYLNNGSGVFTAGSSVITGANPRGLIAADLDNDADPDFVVANHGDNTVTAIRNNAGTLVLGVTVPSGGQEPRAVAAGDFDRDGDVDLAVTNHGTRSVVILSASAAFSYAVSATLSVPPNTRPDGLAAADFDADGDLDLAASTSEQPGVSLISIYTNTAGVFAGPVSFPAGGINPSHVLATDLDLDGRADIAVAHESSGDIAVLQNTSATGGPITLGAPNIIATGAAPQQISAGDLDGNTTPDLAVPNRDANTTSILLNNTTPPPPCRADFNGSGVVDSQDYFDFLTAFFTDAPRADFNADGVINSQDYFDFLSVFFVGCP